MPKNRKTKGQPRPMKRGKRNFGNLRVPVTQVWNQLSQRSPAQMRVMELDNQVFKVAQIVEFGGFLTSSAGGTVSNGIAFNLAQLPQVNTWTAAFDQYLIDKIELWIQPTQATTVASPDGWRWYNAIDYDDDGTSTSENQIQQYQNVIDGSRTEATYRCFIPHIAGGVNSGGSTSLSRNSRSTWIDSGASAVKHFGLKVVMQATAITVVLSLRYRLHVKFRNVF